MGVESCHIHKQLIESQANVHRAVHCTCCSIIIHWRRVLGDERGGGGGGQMTLNEPGRQKIEILMF